LSEPAARSLHEAALAAGVLVTGALLAFGALSISTEAGYGGVGPNFLPWVVSAALVVCGALLLWQALAGGFREREAQRTGQHEADARDQRGGDEHAGRNPRQRHPVAALGDRRRLALAKAAGQRLPQQQRAAHQQRGRHHPRQEVGPDAAVASLGADRQRAERQQRARRQHAQRQPGFVQRAPSLH
jgi:Tripartite tricarboxylate transporter TctB family